MPPNPNTPPAPSNWHPLPIEAGGTGGTTPTVARQKLGLQIPAGGASNVTFLQSGTGAVSRPAQDKLRDIVALADYDTLGHYNTAVAALGSSGNYSFGGTINLPGAGQSNQITWNTSDLALYRFGAGRLAIELGAASGNDTALEVFTSFTNEEGANRIRLWAYNLNTTPNQTYLEIGNDRDVGLEKIYYDSSHQGSGTTRDQVWSFDFAEAMRLNTSKSLSVVTSIKAPLFISPSATTLLFAADAGTGDWAVATSTKHFLPTTNNLRDIGAAANLIRQMFASICSPVATKQFYPATDAGAAQTAAGLFAGTGAPNNANGNNGDFYNRSDGTVAGANIHYHKEAGAWVAYT